MTKERRCWVNWVEARLLKKSESKENPKVSSDKSNIVMTVVANREQG
jgi:hypothetical protein